MKEKMIEEGKYNQIYNFYICFIDQGQTKIEVIMEAKIIIEVNKEVTHHLKKEIPIKEKILKYK